MKRILITGATGNIGTEVINSLLQNNGDNHIVAGVRNVEKARKIIGSHKQLTYCPFDFEDQSTFDQAFRNADIVFLLRPPHISDVDKYFTPLISEISRSGIRQILFLSVQGAEKSSIIPHNRIERLIIESGMDYIFLRPSYFMQNLTTTLLPDIREKRKIILPAGRAKFNWINVQNIGEAAAALIRYFDIHKNSIHEITGTENIDFYSVAEMLSSATGEGIEYRSMNPLGFYWLKKREGTNKGLAMVMTMLHFLPRFQKEPVISGSYTMLTGKRPSSLIEFIERNRNAFISPPSSRSNMVKTRS